MRMALLCQFEHTARNIDTLDIESVSQHQFDESPAATAPDIECPTFLAQKCYRALVLSDAIFLREVVLNPALGDLVITGGDFMRKHLGL